MQNTTTTFQLQNVLDALQSAQGLFGLAMFLLLLVLAGMIKQTKWMVIALLLFISSLGYFRWTNLTLATPFQQMRENGRSICVALMFVLLVPTILASRGWRTRLVSGAIFSYLLFELAYSSRLMIDGDRAKGFFALISFILTFIAFGLGLGRWLQSLKDANWAVWSIAAGGILFTLGTIFQYGVNRGAVIWNNRLLGLTGNPQHAAVLLAISIPACCYLLARRGGSMLLRIGLICALALMIVLLIWTGSRTGVLMTVVGVLLLFRIRLGRFAVLAAMGSIGVFFALKIFGDSLLGVDRLLSTQDTRTGAWRTMWEDFMINPITGISMSEARFSENSYLLAAAHTGLIGLVPLLLAVLLASRLIVRLQRFRRQLGSDAFLVDAVVAGLISIAVGAMFEGHLLAVYSFPLYCIYIYLGLALFLLDYGAATAQQPLVQYETEEMALAAYEYEQARYHTRVSMQAPLHQEKNHNHGIGRRNRIQPRAGAHL